MPQVQVLYWRDIPVQVRVCGGSRPLTQQLPARFQQQIDRIAKGAGLTGTGADLSHWQWSEKEEHAGDPLQLLQDAGRNLLAAHDADVPPSA